MSIPQILALSLVEIIGDFGLKTYANKGGFLPLVAGLTGYVGVIFMLIVSLQGSSILMVNNAWDGTSSILESIAAYIFLGERFDNYMQYVAIIFIMIGVHLLKVPWEKDHPFAVPSL